MGIAIHLKRCACGQAPEIKAARVAEDCMETWVECRCGARAGEVEDAYSDFDTAAWNWNAGRLLLTSAAKPADKP